jgi:outer membrane protein assembly factor BamB
MLRPALILGLLLLLLIPAAAMGAPPADSGEQLRAAAAAGDEAKVRALLDAGTPVDAPARHGRTALLEACWKGHLGVARLLLERGANPSVREAFFGMTALTGALGAGNLELVRLLLDKGAEWADEVLFTAIERDDLGLAKMALDTGRIEPLDLAAARKEAANASAELRELLAKAEGTKRQFPPFRPAAERLAMILGQYQNRDKSVVLVVSQRGTGLELKLTGQEAPIAVEPVEADRFDTADGKISATFAGRGGIIERMMINRDGELLFLGKAPAVEPTDLQASAPAPTAPAAPAVEEETGAGRGAAIVPRPWPMFRGPGSSGVADGQGAPASWDVEKGRGVRFKTPIPGLALSSPVIWGDRIYLTTVVAVEGDPEFNNDKYGDLTPVEDKSEMSFRTYALDTKGKILWQHEIFRGKSGTARHIKSSHANSTPVTDGEKLVVLFGAVGKLAAYDKDGKILWQTELGPLDSTDPPSGTAGWGHAASPILVGDKIIVQVDRHKDSYLAAFALKDGKEIWRTARNDFSSWSTPTLYSSPNGEELVVNGTTIRGYDPKTGAELWKLGPNSEVVVSTPQVGNDLIYVTAGYPPVRPVYAIRPGQRGDLSLPEGESKSKAIAWSYNRGGTYIPTPILYRGYYHTCNNNGIFTTYDAATGQQLSTQRLSQSGMMVTASPVAADGRLFVFGEDGTAYVLSSGPTPALIGTYPMGEAVMSSPAISGGLMVVRTLGHVFGLESAPADGPETKASR